MPTEKPSAIFSATALRKAGLNLDGVTIEQDQVTFQYGPTVLNLRALLRGANREAWGADRENTPKNRGKI
jgi:hypothetical protein